MIVDLRTYTLVPRKMARYLELFETHGLPVMRRHGLELMGYYVSHIGPLNQVVHLWRYDSFAVSPTWRGSARHVTPTSTGPGSCLSQKAWFCRRTTRSCARPRSRPRTKPDPTAPGTAGTRAPRRAA